MKTLRGEIEKMIEKHQEHARFAKMSKMASFATSQAEKWNLVMRRDEFIRDALQSALDRTKEQP